MSELVAPGRSTANMHFIHNCFGSYFRGVLNWFSDKFYPRFNYRVIGTYDKAVEFFNKKKQIGTEVNSQLLPSLTLDPMLDFSNEERVGRTLWQYSVYAPGQAFRMWNAIDLKEQDVTVTPCYSRYQGTFEVTFWLESVYELMDYRVMLLQFCGGFNRWVRPEYFWSYIILPGEVRNYKKDDTELLDWANTDADIVHVDTINKHALGIPIPLDSIWRLDSFNDNSTKYGGDQITEYKLSATFTYEVNIPTFIVINEPVDPNLKLSFSLGSTQTSYPLVAPYQIITKMAKFKESEAFLNAEFKLYNVTDPVAAVDNLITSFSHFSLSFPFIPEHWNHIVSGNLLLIDSSFLLEGSVDRITRNDIIYFDSYRPEYIPFIRKALAVISGHDRYDGELYSKCESLKKPMICNLNQQEIDLVIQNQNTVVTLDVLRKKLYRGKLESGEDNEANSVFAFELLKIAKEQYPQLYKKAVDSFPVSQRTLPAHHGYQYTDAVEKRLIYKNCDGVINRFYLKFDFDPAHEEDYQIYIDNDYQRYNIDYTVIGTEIIEFVTPPPIGSDIYLGGKLISIKTAQLNGVYEFTQEDVDEFHRASNLILQLPSNLRDVNDLVVVSYGGKLENGKDYTINLETQQMTLVVAPIPEEIIEFFYFVVD